MLLIWFVTLELYAKNSNNLTHNMKAATTEIVPSKSIQVPIFLLPTAREIAWESQQCPRAHSRQVWLNVWTCIYMMGS